MIKLTGLWKKTAKSGLVYYTGNLRGNVVIKIFPVKEKMSPNTPDFELFIDEITDKKEMEINTNDQN